MDIPWEEVIYTTKYGKQSKVWNYFLPNGERITIGAAAKAYLENMESMKFHGSRFERHRKSAHLVLRKLPIKYMPLFINHPSESIKRIVQRRLKNG